MKVLHLMLSNFYIDHANYQENVLPRINKRDGHDVLIVASTDVFIENNKLGLTSPGEYYNEDGIKVIRIPYKKIISDWVSQKIRSYKGLWAILNEFNPDVILFHGSVALELNIVGKFKKKFSNVKLLVDSHEDFNNSARNFLSRNLLHRFFYKRILRRNLKHIDKILYITKETYNFLHEFYRVPDEKLEFFPLGGEIPSVEMVNDTRLRIRKELGIEENHILCIHSGKIDKLKRTDEILAAFSAVKREDLRLVIIGSIDNEFNELLNTYLQDKRIQFLGWKKSSELREYLIAGDLYLQLGSQSATMQQAICNGNVVAIYPFESHTFLLKDACFYIENKDDIERLLSRITWSEIMEKKTKSYKIATELLDYNVIANSIFTI